MNINAVPFRYAGCEKQGCGSLHIQQHGAVGQAAAAAVCPSLFPPPHQVSFDSIKPSNALLPPFALRGTAFLIVC